MSPNFRSGWLILTLLLPGFVSATLPTPADSPPTTPAADPADASAAGPAASSASGSTDASGILKDSVSPSETHAKTDADHGETKAKAKLRAAAKNEPKAESTAKDVAKAEVTAVAEAKPRPDRASLEKLVAAAAERHGVELALVKAVVAAESAYDPQAVSRAGARGLMQVMPATAVDYGVADQERLFDPETNLDTGTRHLKRLLAKYKNDYGRAIMAYNAGEGVVDRTGSMVTYAETLSYTEAVIRHYRRQGGTKPTDEALAKVRQLRKLKGQQAKQLLAKYLDLNLPSLRGSSRTIRVVAPGLDENSAKRRPMIVLETRKPEDPGKKLD